MDNWIIKIFFSKSNLKRLVAEKEQEIEHLKYYIENLKFVHKTEMNLLQIRHDRLAAQFLSTLTEGLKQDNP